MKKKTIAIICAALAVVVAFGLLLGSGFGFIPLLRGAQPAPEQGADWQAGAYVQTDVRFIMDICAVERAANGDPVAYHAVAPMGNTFVMVRFPAAEYENALAMKQATDDYLSGKSGMSVHLSVTGTTVKMDEETRGYMEQWFQNNAEKMSQSGLIAAVEDYSVYLNSVAIESGMVGSVRQVSVMTAVCLSAAALALLVLAVVLFIIAGIDTADKKPEKKAPAPYASYSETGVETKTETPAASEPEEEESENEPHAGADAEDEEMDDEEDADDDVEDDEEDDEEDDDTDDDAEEDEDEGNDA